MKESALCAERALQQTDSAIRRPARGDAEISLIGVRCVKHVGNQPVYNMEVETHHNFAVNGGYIVHNCIDSTRYLAEDLIAERAIRTMSRAALGF